MKSYYQKGHVQYYQCENGFIGELNIGGFDFNSKRYHIKTFRTPIAETLKQAERYMEVHILNFFNKRRMI